MAACDYCLYFLSAYNVTAPPAACVGGCSIGTYGNCASVVGTAIKEAFLKDVGN